MNVVADRNDRGLTFCKPVSTVPNILFVDGLARSGKSSLCRLITTFERLEIERIDMIYDYVGMLNAFGKLDRDTAVAMERMFADLSLYDNYICRNVNFRWRDTSSVFHFPRPLVYMKRLFSRGKDQAIREIEAENPILLSQTHNQLENIDLHFDSFPESLRVVSVVRHPVNLAYAWWKTGHGENLCESKWNQIFCISRNGSPPAHHLAIGWEEQFQGMAPIDRIIRMHHDYMVRAQKTFGSLDIDRSAKIFQLRNRSLFTAPERIADKLCAFLNTTATRKSRAVIRKMQRTNDDDEPMCHAQQNEIHAQCSAESRARLGDMIDIYETQRYSL